MKRLFKPLLLVLLGVVVGVGVTKLQAQHHQGSHGAGHHGAAAGTDASRGASMPVEAGEAAFASISEIVSLLRADPDTDWTAVNVNALRDHLVDMHRLTVDSRVTQKNTDKGVVLTVSGTPESMEAASRMLPAHSHMLVNTNSWEASVAQEGNELIWTVTAVSAPDVVMLQGLGFYGILATGSHHQPHHLAVASGRPMH